MPRQVVGQSKNVDSMLRAYSWTQAGGMSDLGDLGGGYSDARAVSVSGQIAGTSLLGDFTQHAISWTQAGGLVDLGTLGGDQAWATALSDTGQVVGDSTVIGDMTRAFLWTRTGGMIELGRPADFDTTHATAINATHVVGWGSTATGTHALLWTPVSPPTVTLTVSPVIVAFDPAGAAVNVVVTSDAGIATCAADGQPFVSGNTLSLGSHAIVCSATNPSTGATGQATATVTIVLSGPSGAPGAPGPQGPQGEGLLSGSLLMLPSGSPAPPAATYDLIGTFTLGPASGKQPRRGLVVDVYRRK
jgi:probable HAF family extracellular repeat protein